MPTPPPLRVLGLVPARGGSRGVPGKNGRALGGRPLLAWTAEAACAARTLARRVLSTDDPALAELGVRCGLEVPFVRPAPLARDDTPMLPVVGHALRWFADRGEPFDAVCLLQPTAPFREPGEVDACVARLVETGADSVVTVRPIPPEHHPRWAYLRDEDGTLHLATGADAPPARRQALPPAYHRDGSVYVTRAAVVRAGSLYGTRTVGVEMPRRRHVNIDTPDDWHEAERLAAQEA